MAEDGGESDGKGDSKMKEKVGYFSEIISTGGNLDVKKKALPTSA